MPYFSLSDSSVKKVSIVYLTGFMATEFRWQTPLPRLRLLSCALSLKTFGISRPVAALLVEWFRVLMCSPKCNHSQLDERETVAYCDDICHH